MVRVPFAAAMRAISMESSIAAGTVVYAGQDVGVEVVQEFFILSVYQ